MRLRTEVGLAESNRGLDLGGNAIVLDAVADDLDEASDIGLGQFLESLATNDGRLRRGDIDGRVFGAGLCG
jgi:hypothetical protein